MVERYCNISLILIFQDDLWRRNNATVSSLKTHATDFDPSYPSSIAYRLLPRAALEAFLIQRGLMSKKGGWTDFIHSGILNKIYFRLNQIVFKASSDNVRAFSPPLSHLKL